MVDTSYKVYVNSDNIESKSQDKARIDRCVAALKQAGYNAVSSGVGPNWHVSDMRTHKNSYIVCIVGGLCAGTIADYAATYYQNYMKNNNNKGGQAYFAKYGKYKVPASQLPWLERAWDDNFSPRGFKGCKPSEYLSKAGFDEAFALDDDSFPQAVVSMVQNGGLGVSSGGTGGSNNVGNLKPTKGFVNSGRGTSPQYWNRENYSSYVEVPFHKIRMTDEDPHVKTATIETTEELPLMEGRDAMLITGDDCNDFGGICIKKEYNKESNKWEYTCQGFLDRILANEITYVADGTETVHEIITNVLEDTGPPTDNLLPIDEYDTAVTEETQKLLKADADLTETSQAFSQQQQDSGGGGGSSSSEEGEKTDTKTYTKTLNTTKKGDVINPMKKKPVGLFKQKTLGDFFRTLIFDYGVNVNFYGDINGIPHFDIMDLETWKKSGFLLPQEMGFGSDYQYGLDITNIITQVGIENISAINGAGEIYTSNELLGVPLEDFVGRMGVVLDNPSAQGSTNTGEESVKIEEKYQDSTGKKYEPSQVITTKGKPSCTNCAHKNGGVQPVYQSYSKAWLNKCPGCNTENKLKSEETGDGVTTCQSCNKTYCQYCGYSTNGGKYQLTELFLTQTSNNTNESKKSTTTVTTNDTGDTSHD